MANSVKSPERINSYAPPHPPPDHHPPCPTKCMENSTAEKFSRGSRRGIKDKIVQQDIKTAIEPRMDKMFLNASYGYRPGKGPERTVKRMRNELNKFTFKPYIAKW